MSIGKERPRARVGAASRKRPHRKSRNGCVNCKRRKVKCNEEKPTCFNCANFGIPCSYLPSTSTSIIRSEPWLQPPVGPKPTSLPAPGGGVEPTQSVSQPRGRGRPRKDWTAPAPRAACSAAPSLLLSGSPSSLASPCTLNVDDAELLLHFVSSTAQTFVTGGAHKPDDKIVRFWTHNVPRIGLAHHFVLHFMFAVAAHHLAYLKPPTTDADDGQRKKHTSLAARHLSAGLAEITKVLPGLNDDNCGALYVAATLVCYCTFAAGPTGPADLLLCDVDIDGDGRTRWLPLIRGLKYIRDAADPEALWSGLMAPLGPPREDEPAPEHGRRPPTCVREEFPRVEWTGTFGRLRGLVSGDDGPGREMYIRCFERLQEIYMATYGKGDGADDDGPRDGQFVYGWLYRVEDEYVARLRAREPLALVLLAYFVPLLRTTRDWFLEGWVEHLLKRIREYIPRGTVHWLRWPTEQAGVGWVDPPPSNTSLVEESGD